MTAPSINLKNIFRFGLQCVFVLALLLVATEVSAATLRLSPDTGVYSSGGTFTARVIINTSGQSVNAAEGTLSYNPRELSVVSVTRSGSIFNLWTQEPTFSPSAGTISFGGGSPTGYTGSAGNVMSVTFRALNSGTSKVTFSAGSVLAADGLGTNVLTSMQGASYTINAQATNPEPEYIAPANTPAAPVVTSSSHPDQNAWYANTIAELSFAVPSGVTSMRTLLDESSGSIPTVVYDTPISSRTLEDLPQGVSYFHIQYRNADGWGKVTHYRLGVDTEKPTRFDISEPEDSDSANPQRSLIFDVEDISPVKKYLVQIDGGEAITFEDEEETGRYALPSLSPGRHSVIVEAFDSAGNSLISTYAFDVASFEKPVFTEYPSRLNTEVIPVISGSTRPNSTVTISVFHAGVLTTHELHSNEQGAFTFIPDAPFGLGVVELSAVATDEYGVQSESSDTIRIIVEEPGYVRIGTFVVSVLSVFIPLIALLLVFVFGIWYFWHKLSLWRKKILKETNEAEAKLASEFALLTKHLDQKIEQLRKSRKGKLTLAESALIDEMRADIASAKSKIAKEISDIDDVVQ